jgi:putative ABC transport system permease protein
MKSAFWKDLFREIKHTPGRFISLIIITVLGAASVVGIQATSIDMRNIADKTYKEHNLYDLQIKSSVGFGEDDINALGVMAGVSKIMPTIIYDTFINIENENRAVRTYALPDGINEVDILDGRLPTNNRECVVEQRLMDDSGFQIGDTITLGLDDMTDYFDVFADDTFTVVGIVKSPLYITFQRGNTALGDGSLRYYLYLHPDAYKLDVYTDIYVLMDGSHGMDNLTEDYYAAADEWKRQTEQTGALRVQAKKDELTDAQREIDEGWGEYFDVVKELEEKTSDGQRELEDAKLKLDDAKAELEAGQRTLDKKIADGLAEIDSLAGILGSEQIDNARAALEEERKKAQAEINSGWAEYSTGLEEWGNGVLTLEAEEADALAELADAKRELEEAQEKLNDAPTPEWFYFTRKDGVAFDSYYQDTLRLQKIGYVFPLVFFLVAVMVSLTSMSRMVEDHRTQIGVYKALGYRPAAVMMKYLIYAFSASTIGGMVGAALGSWIFPLIISDAYGHLYSMPPVETPIPLSIAAIAIVSAVLAVVLVTLGTYISSMRGNPALLMRPKSPAKGKRVLLERATFIWKRLGFFSKVTARNVFRYKKRFIMTLAGVAGCSALLLTAFGLRDSIGAVTNLQYGTIIKYDARAYLKDITADEQKDKLTTLLPDDHLYIREEAVTANGTGGGLSASLLVPELPESLSDYINLYSPEAGEQVSMTAESVLITEKLSRVMGVGAGGSFTMTFNDGRAFTAEVTGVVDNYIQHFIYMSPNVYADLFGEEPYANSTLIFYDETEPDSKLSGRAFAAPLLENSDVRALIHNDELMTQIGDQTDAMGIVTIVLIVLACALAFVVLFNLTNINISERIRELATMKVLGLNDTELAMYIYRENGVVTMLGILLGLVGGFFLHGYVLTSVEIDVLKFPQIIYPQRYIIAVVLSAVFAVFVNIIMSVKLAKIDMVESLKNVE